VTEGQYTGALTFETAGQFDGTVMRLVQLVVLSDASFLHVDAKAPVP
jgi:hypothetical protein